MKFAISLLLAAVCSPSPTSAQVLPDSISCAVSASMVSCEGLSAIPKGKAEGGLSRQTVRDGHSEFFVIQINLSPGAPLKRWVPGEDELIIGLGGGELVNEAKSPPLYIRVDKGLLLLMPKEEPYELRNVGKQEVDLLVVRMHPTSPASH